MIMLNLLNNVLLICFSQIKVFYRMKFMLSIVALLLISSTASYADTPAILGSVSQGAAQVMAKDDAAKTRGEYRICSVSNPHTCRTQSFSKPMQTGVVYGERWTLVSKTMQGY